MDLQVVADHLEDEDAKEDLHAEAVDVEQVRVDSEPYVQVAEMICTFVYVIKNFQNKSYKIEFFIFSVILILFNLQVLVLLVLVIGDQVGADVVLLVVVDGDLLVVHLPLEDMSPVALVEAVEKNTLIII